jgi:hypothetical protein
MRTSVVGRAVFITSLPLVLAALLQAQQQTMSPPPFLQIFQEQVKPGRAGPHVPAEAGWPRAFAKAKIPNHYIALTTIYGLPEAWFCAGVGSIADIEQQNQAIEKAPGLSKELDRLSQADAANLSGYRAVLGRYRPDLSNQPDINPAEMRVWEVITFTVKPGHEGDFAEGAKIYRGLVQNAKATIPWATFEVMAGMPGPVYLVFVPHKSLAEIDPNTGAMAAIEKSMDEPTMKKFATVSEGYSSVESRIFAVSPEMSYPRPDWVTQDPEFWGKKPKTTAAGNSAPPRSGSQ